MTGCQCSTHAKFYEYERRLAAAEEAMRKVAESRQYQGMREGEMKPIYDYLKKYGVSWWSPGK